MRGTPTCTDCGATMEKWGDCWRCPWAKVRGGQVRGHSSGSAFSCGRPYKEKRNDIMAPITGRPGRG